MGVKPSTDEIYNQLKILIDDENKREEKECRRYLQFAKYLLFREPVIDFVYVENEYLGYTGVLDYVISGKVRDESGFECVRAYIWELKAPQCFMFKRDIKNRLCPSADLIKAENQLLHYYLEQKGSNLFREKFGVINPDDIRLGGIIIGCYKTEVRGKYDILKKSQLYEMAIRTRKLLYEPIGIRLMTWNNVLDHLKPPTNRRIQ